MIEVELIQNTKVHRCCICNKTFEGYGNNPSPVVNDNTAECCDRCNLEIVFPARIKSLEECRKDDLHGENNSY